MAVRIRPTKKNIITELLIVTAISVCLLCAMTVLYIIDGQGHIISAVLVCLWAFSLPPAYVFIFKWLNKKTFAEGARIGNNFSDTADVNGVPVPIGLIIPIFIAPYLMVCYCNGIIKHIKRRG